MRRRRRSGSSADESGVAMSPLIDCVFLLLIFFLVTTIIKRKEKQVRVEMPDTSASVSKKTVSKEFIIGMNKFGQNLQVVGKTTDGGISWGGIPDLSVFLKKRIEQEGVSFLQKPLRIDADGGIEFQKAIDTLDICTLIGFKTVSIKLKQSAE
jgi:biopolymer transport protein ExbD